MGDHEFFTVFTHARTTHEVTVETRDGLHPESLHHETSVAVRYCSCGTRAETHFERDEIDFERERLAAQDHLLAHVLGYLNEDGDPPERQSLLVDADREQAT